MFGPWRDHPGVEREEVLAFLKRDDALNKANRLLKHLSEFAERVMVRVGQRAHPHSQSLDELRECPECNEWQTRYGAAFEEELKNDPIVSALLRRKPPHGPG